MKLAIVASHPIQYHTPLYRELARRIDLDVFYAHRVSGADQERAGFARAFDWDVPLLDGYRATWLDNRAARPGVDRFRGCDTPDIGERLSERRFDAVLVHGWNLLCFWQAVRAAKKLGIPVLVRGDSQLSTPRSPLVRRVKDVLYPRLLGAFDAFLSVGQRNREYLLYYGVPSVRIFHSPHSVDNESFGAATERARQHLRDVRRRFGIPDDRIVILFAGRFVPKKRVSDFLSALDVLNRRHVGVRGLLVGDGPLREALHLHVCAHGTPATFAGFANQSEMPGAYAVADVLVLPSDGRETWGLVVNEAMASGLPAIVSEQVGCAADLVVHGETGFIFACGNVDELAARMEQIATDDELRKAMSAQALRHIGAYSVAQTCDGVMSAMRYLTDRRSAA